LGIPYWRKQVVKIEACETKDRNYNGNKDDLVDLQDKVTKSQEEKYDRDVEKSEDKVRGLWQAFDAIGQKEVNPRSLQGVSGMLESADIGPSPSLNERRKEGGRKTAYEAYEPEDIHSAVRRRYMKGRVKLWGSKTDWHLAAHRGELL